jgi:two-component sensor histidine kinase
MVVDKYLPAIRKRRELGLVLSAGLIGAAFLLRYYSPLQVPFITFFPAVMLAAFVAGRWTGFALTAVSALISIYFFLAPEHTWTLPWNRVPDLIAFIAVCVVLTIAADAAATALDRLQLAKERHQVLLREMAHRLKNQYAVVSAIAHSLGREAHSVEDFDRLLTDKLQGLASSHDLLVAGTWNGASLKELVNAHLLPFCSVIQFQARGEDITLDAEAVQYLGMAFHELCTNASKYGALTSKEGTIDITWHTGDESLTVKWEEHLPHVVDARQSAATGFGHKVLTLITPAALRGTAQLEMLATGLRWTLVMPLANNRPTSQDTSPGMAHPSVETGS